MRTTALPAIAPAPIPPEAAGRDRSDVALLVARRASGEIVDARFAALSEFLERGDLLVVNTSATLAASLQAGSSAGALRVHLSSRLTRRRWVVELRHADGGRARTVPSSPRLELAGGGLVTLLGPYRDSDRLAEAELELPESTDRYLAAHGRPITYGDGAAWALDAYQTVFALEPGGAEMASAGRPFSAELVTELVSRGVLFTPLVLHAGVSSLEAGESPFPERYEVPGETARLVNAVRGWGSRVIAVGTTVVRALETVAAEDGQVTAGEGWTDLVITPRRGLRAIDGMLTGWHEPESSHLLMLEAAAGPELLARSYEAAAELGYSGHEFGDSHLILP